MGRPQDEQTRRMTPSSGARKWAWRALLSALAGGGLTAAGLGPISAALAAEAPASGSSEGSVTTTPSEGASEATSTQPTTTTSTPVASTPAAPTTTATTSPATTPTPASEPWHGGIEVEEPSKPKTKSPAVVLQRRQKVTAAKPASSSVTPTQPATQAPANSNVAAAPQMIAAQEEALAAELAGSAASAQALSFYRIPLFLLPIYQAASVQYGIPWQILAAINEIETNYGTDQSVSTAGAVGWMQFMPATWIQYGVDALDAGYADPYNPVDAIFAAARYLRAAGAATDLHGAILAYNHSEEYVKSVLLRAKLISSYPKSVIATLTGLTDGRVPVSGKQVAWGSLSTSPSPSTVASGSSATAGAVAASSKPATKLSAPTTQGATTPGSSAAPAPGAAVSGAAKKTKHANVLQLVDLMSAPNASIVAAQDGRIVKLGNSQKLGKYLILRDVYGDVFTYAGLGSIASHYPKPKAPKAKNAAATSSLPAVADAGEAKPTLPATAGHHAPVTLQVKTPKPKHTASSSASSEPPPATGKVRLFAHPGNPDALASAAAKSKRAARSDRAGRLLPLRAGSIVSKGTVLGRVRTPAGALDGHLRFAVRPGGDQSTVDPRPILANWQQLGLALHPQGTNNGEADLLGATASGVFLMSQEELQRTVLSDPGIDIYQCGREDIAKGAIDKRVLAVLAYLSRINLKPTVSALECGHSEMTVSGFVSEHYTGDAVDVSAINGIPIAGHQGAGTITDLTIRTLLTLQGEFVPHQIISLMKYPGAANTLAMPEHWNHIHIGFHPAAGELPQAPGASADAAHSARTAKSAPAPVIMPSDLSTTQWNQLVARIGSLPAPKVAAKPSSSAIKDSKSKTPKGN
jgi:soluble lytic murein transglycosylase-like protein